MRHSLILILLSLAIMFSAGCSSVSTLHPLSSNPEPIDQELFEGAWLAGEQVLHVKFSSDGVARIAEVKWEDDQFRITHGEMIVTKGEEHNFLSFRYRSDDNWANNYFLLAYKFTDQGDLIIWMPDPDVFEDMVKKEVLHGSITNGKYSTHVVMTNSPPALLNVINDPDNLEMFDYRKPLVLKRIITHD